MIVTQRYDTTSPSSQIDINHWEWGFISLHLFDTAVSVWIQTCVDSANSHAWRRSCGGRWREVCRAKRGGSGQKKIHCWHARNLIIIYFLLILYVFRGPDVPEVNGNGSRKGQPFRKRLAPDKGSKHMRNGKDHKWFCLFESCRPNGQNVTASCNHWPGWQWPSRPAWHNEVVKAPFLTPTKSCDSCKLSWAKLGTCSKPPKSSQNIFFCCSGKKNSRMKDLEFDIQNKQ